MPQPEPKPGPISEPQPEPEPKVVPPPHPLKIKPPPEEGIKGGLLSRKPPISSGISKVRVKPGTISWRQGAVWHYVEPPYKKDNFHTSKNPLPGTYKFATGPGSSYATLQVLGGKPPDDVDVDLGWAKVHITKQRGNDLEIKFLEGETANVDYRLPEGGTVHSSYVENPEPIKDRNTYADVYPEGEDADVGLKPENMKDTIIEKIPKGQSIKTETPIGLRKVELPQYKSGRIKVYTVDAEWLRNQNVPMGTYDDGTPRNSVDFTQGGHSRVYPLLIPRNEIWIDRKLGLVDGKATLLHELYEYRAMGKGKVYEEAHDEANPIEVEARQNINELDSMIKEELALYNQKKLKPQLPKRKIEEEYEEPVREIKRRPFNVSTTLGEPTYFGKKILTPNMGGL